MPAGAGRRRLEAPRALMTEKIVAGEDVVHPEAVGAGVALADVALEETIVAHDRAALLILKELLRRGAAARLATARQLHGHEYPPDRIPVQEETKFITPR